MGPRWVESFDVSETIRVEIQLLDDLPAPTYAHEGDAGLDLRARTDTRIRPWHRAIVATGVAIALPEGFAAFIHPRSGLAARHGLTIVNAPGTVDAGYRGEINVILLNTDATHTLDLARGDRIAQLIIQRVVTAELIDVTELESSERGGSGLGSSGGWQLMQEGMS